MRILDKAIAESVPVVPRPIVRSISRRYIAGDTLDEAVETVRNLNRQGCVATIDLLGESTESKADAGMGPVISEPQFEKVSSYISLGKSEGERLLGEDPGDPERGYFVTPTLFEVDPKARVAQEEIFGPVLSVIRARDFEDALAIANDNPYGLTGGVYSRNRDHLELARREFNAGNVYFNRKITGALVGVQPFGGFGMSGTDSKACGPDYLPLHMLAKTVVERF
jgi:1-pyrroline-5-carboxylate dehydrogenase